MIISSIMNYFKRRKHLRMKTHDLARVSLGENEKAYILVNIVNLSEGGLQFVWQKKIPTGHEVDIEVNLAREDVRLKLKGKILWCRKEKTGSTFLVGTLFTNITDKEIRAIREWIKNVGKE